MKVSNNIAFQARIAIDKKIVKSNLKIAGAYSASIVSSAGAAMSGTEWVSLGPIHGFSDAVGQIGLTTMSLASSAGSYKLNKLAKHLEKQNKIPS